MLRKYFSDDIKCIGKYFNVESLNAGNFMT